MPRFTPRSATTSPRSWLRSAGASAVARRRRSTAATATGNSSSRPSVVERLAIDRLGHRGDGIANGPEGPIYVPGTLPGETVEVEAVPGHPDRRRLLKVDTPSGQRIAPICPHFGVCG